MKWIQSNQPSDLVQNYFLIENNLLREKLRYQPFQQSARIYCAEKQQVFFIKPGSKKSTGFTIENEYGFSEGCIIMEPGETKELKGYISIGPYQQTFTVQQLETATPQMQSSASGLPAAAINCSLPPAPGLHPGQQDVKGICHLHAALIWSLHWWLYTDRYNRPDSTATAVTGQTRILVH